MVEEARRRRPRALGAIVALLASNGLGASAFVLSYGSSVVSMSALHSRHSPLSPAARSVNPPRQHPVGKRRQHATGRRAINPRVSTTCLQGAVDPNVIVDHFDGWNPQQGTEIGTVSLVGSGPGDPDLLTVAALRELQSADLVIADRLVSKEILGLVSALTVSNISGCEYAFVVAVPCDEQKIGGSLRDCTVVHTTSLEGVVGFKTGVSCSSNRSNGMLPPGGPGVMKPQNTLFPGENKRAKHTVSVYFAVSLYLALLNTALSRRACARSAIQFVPGLRREHDEESAC